jgi:hypothetical protein
MKRLAIFALVLCVCAALAWIGGFNFDQRGKDSFLWSFCSLIAAALIATFPGLDKD